jgi:hypothetical protein
MEWYVACTLTNGRILQKLMRETSKQLPPNLIITTAMIKFLWT